MANIPTEVVESCILPRLPVKTLVRFKSVSKSWKTLISSTNFLHLQHRHANRLLLISVVDPTAVQVHNLDSLLDPPFLCPYPYNEQRPDVWDNMMVLASCEFFVLVGRWLSSVAALNSLFLLNPSTLSYHRIPIEGIGLSSTIKYGLYFDEANDDCKVARIEQFYDGDAYDWEVKIYSCNTNLWRLIKHNLISDPNYHIEPMSIECVHKNLLYLIFDSFVDIRIRCFDIQAEEWTTRDILFPHYLVFHELRVLDDGLLYVLGVDDEVLGIYDEKDRTRDYCMWVLNENDGVKESWVKLMNIVTKYVGEPRYRPLAYRKGSQHELLCRRFWNAELFWYNLSYKIATKAEFDGGAENECLFIRVDHTCKESLLCFHGGDS